MCVCAAVRLSRRLPLTSLIWTMVTVLWAVFWMVFVVAVLQADAVTLCDVQLKQQMGYRGGSEEARCNGARMRSQVRFSSSATRAARLAKSLSGSIEYDHVTYASRIKIYFRLSDRLRFIRNSPPSQHAIDIALPMPNSGELAPDPTLWSRRMHQYFAP